MALGCLVRSYRDWMPNVFLIEFLHTPATAKLESSTCKHGFHADPLNRTLVPGARIDAQNQSLLAWF